MGLFIDLFNQYRNQSTSLQSSPFVSIEQKTMAHGRIRVEIIDALNGRVLEINHRPHENADWHTELYIVRDDEALAEAIAAVLIVGGAK
jgi:hypothetical protein